MFDTNADIGRGSPPVRAAHITCRRRWIAFTCSAFLLSVGAAWARSTVTVADPNSFPHVEQHARITVLFDGIPIAGATVDVRKFGNSDAIATLTTDSKGQTVLPALPDGPYQIVAWQSRGTSAGFEACVGACPRPFAVVDVTAANLDGEVKIVDDATGISEFWMEIGPFQFQSRTKLIAAAESQSIIRTLREFHGTVTDPTGALIRGAWISVLRHGKEGDEEIALLRTDDNGAFSAKLPEGRYIILVAAAGFEDQATPLAILPTGEPTTFKVSLRILPAVE